MAVNEFLLLKRFSASGDAEAFAEITREHAPLVYGVCLRILEDRDTAADVVQDTFLQLARNADTITGSLPNWLHRVAKNKAIKLIHQNSARKQREKIFAADSEIESQEERVSWQEISNCIDEELDQLDDLTREVIILHFFENQTMTEIAENFGISQPTVSRRIESGIDSLRQKLKSRGVIVPAAILTALLTENIVQAAPVSIMKELGKIALAGSKVVTPTVIGSGITAIKLIIVITAISLVGIGLYVFYSNSNQEVETTMSNDELLAFLVEQNEAARDKIKTAEYFVTWTSFVDIAEGQRQNNATGHVKLKGKWRYSTYENYASVPATGWEQFQSACMAINDRYLTYWPIIGNPNIYVEDIISIDTLSDEIKQLSYGLTTQDIQSLNFAFGGETNSSFREIMKLHPDKIRWTAEKENRSKNNFVYLIKQYAPLTNDRSIPYSIWTIDPRKGFLVTDAVYFSREGNVWITRTVEAKEISNGIWFPMSFHENRYDDIDDNPAKDEPTSNTNIQIENISLNIEIPDNDFTLSAILPEEYRESTDVFRTGLDGITEKINYNYKNDIPRNQ